MAVGAAIASTGLAVLPAPPSEARYATGGNGAYLGAVDWFEWGADGTAIPTAGLTRTNTRTVAGATLATTCTISSLSGSIRAYRSGNWRGDGMDEMYNIGGTGTSNQLVAGLANTNSGTTPSFHFACSTTLDGTPVPLAGLVMADAEQSGSNEYIQATIPAGAEWRLIDRFRTAGCTADPTVNRTGQTLRLTGPATVCASGPDGIAFMDGATSAEVQLKGGGVSAIALGVMLFNDFGDAPASYGAAGSLYSPSFAGGVVPQGDSSLFGATLNTPTQPTSRLGPTVDSEPNAQISADATADGADEDGINPPSSIIVTPGTTHTLAGVACTGPGVVAGWLDWNGNGTFDPGERSNRPDCTGSSVDLVWDVPADARSGATFLRLRIGPTSASVATPSGVTTAGEVEDYRIAVTALADFGDAPATYGTAAEGVASHTVLGYDAAERTAPTMLGGHVDVEGGAEPGADADGDDTSGTPDDEDGIAGPPGITYREPSSLTVSATNDSDEDVTLAGWVDLDGDGQFEDDERVTVTVPANSGTADYQLDFPAGTTTTHTFARFRIYGGVVADPQSTGNAVRGEVEDYAVTLLTPELDIEKTSDATVDSRPGDTITYTVTVENTGTGDYTAANPARVWDDLSDVLDDATYNHDAAADRDPTTPTYGGGIVSWTGALPAGETVIVTYTVTLKGGGDGTVRNVAFEQCDPASNCDPVTPTCDPPVGGVDPDTGKRCAEEEFGLPKLTIVKVADRTDLPAVGETVTYKVTVTNEGPGDFTASAPGTATDDLSDVIDDTSEPTNITASVGTATFTSPDLTWTGVLAEGDLATIEYTVTYTGAGDRQLDNNACVPVEEAQDPQDPCGQVRIPGSGLDQDKVSDPPSGAAVDVGEEITYTLRFTNTGRTAASVDTFDDLSRVLDDAEFVAGSLTAGGGLNAAYDAPGERVVVTGSVPVGEELEITYRVRVRAWADQGDHVLRNGLKCQPGDPQPCEPEVTEHAVRALDIEKTSDRTADTVIGDTVTYTVTAENIGEADYTAAGPAIVRDTLAGVLDDADYDNDAAADRAGAVTYSRPVIRWEGALAVGDTVTIAYRVTLKAGGDQTVRNVAWGGPGPDPRCDPPSAAGVDPDTGQPCAEVEYLLPDIIDSKSVDTADGTVVVAGDELTYTLRYENRGTGAGQLRRDDFVGMWQDDATLASGPTVTGQGSLTAALIGDRIEVRGTLGAGETATVTYRVRVKPDGRRAADGGDNMLGNFLIGPGATPPTDCRPAADEDSTCNPVRALRIAKTSNQTAHSTFGDTITYKVTATNTGQADYTAVDPALVRDTLAGVLDDAAYNHDASADLAGTVSYSEPVMRWEGALAVDQSVTITYTVTLKRGGDLKVHNVAWGGPGPEPECDPPAVAGYDPVSGQPCDEDEFGVPDLKDSKSVDPVSGSTVNTGQTLNYTLRFTNDGTAPASVSKVDNLSQVLDDARMAAPPVSSDPALTVSTIRGGQFSINGTLAAGQTVTVTYGVHVNRPGDLGDRMLGNHLLGVGEEPPPSWQCLRQMGEDSTCNLVRTFDLVLEKEAVGRPQVMVGDNVRYRLRVINRGPDATLAPIKLTDELPRGLALKSAHGKGWDCHVRRASDSVTCVRDEVLGPHRKAVVFVVAKATKAALGRRVVNIAQVGAAGGASRANDRDKAAVTVVRVPPLPSTGFRNVPGDWL